MLVGLLLLLLLFFFFFFLPFTSCWVALSYRCKHARYLCCALPLVLAAAEEETDAIEDVLASLATAVHMEQLEADGGASSDDDDDDDGQGAGKNSAADMNSDVLDLFQQPELHAPAHVLQRRLSVSIKRGELNPNRALQAAAFIDKQLRRLVLCVQNYGSEDRRHRRWKISLGRLADKAKDMFSDQVG